MNPLPADTAVLSPTRPFSPSRSLLTLSEASVSGFEPCGMRFVPRGSRSERYRFRLGRYRSTHIRHTDTALSRTVQAAFGTEIGLSRTAQGAFGVPKPPCPVPFMAHSVPFKAQTDASAHRTPPSAARPAPSMPRTDTPVSRAETLVSRIAPQGQNVSNRRWNSRSEWNRRIDTIPIISPAGAELLVAA